MFKIPLYKLWNKINIIFVLIFTILFGVVFFVSNLNYFFNQNIATMTTKKLDKSLVMLDKNIKFDSSKQYIMQNYNVSWEREINSITLLDDELFDFLADRKTNGLDFLSNNKYWAESEPRNNVAGYERGIYEGLANETIAMQKTNLVLNNKAVNFVGNFKLYLADLSQNTNTEVDIKIIQSGPIIFRLSDKEKILPPNSEPEVDLLIHKFSNESNISTNEIKNYTTISTGNQKISKYYEFNLFKYLNILVCMFLGVFGIVGIIIFSKSWKAQEKYRFLYIANGSDISQIAQIYLVFYGLLLIPSTILGIVLAKIALQLSLNFWTTNIFDKALVLGNNYSFEAVSFFAPNLFLVIIWVFLVIFSTLIFYAKSNN